MTNSLAEMEKEAEDFLEENLGTTFMEAIFPELRRIIILAMIGFAGERTRVSLREVRAEITRARRQ